MHAVKQVSKSQVKLRLDRAWTGDRLETQGAAGTGSDPSTACEVTM